MNSSPKISVVITSHNRAQFLSFSIESILNQTFKNFELIVVDDGSDSEEPADIVRKYMAQDPRVRLITQENEGLPSARNAGVGIARGTYIAFQDDDDMSIAIRLAKQNDFLDAHPEVAGIANCMVDDIDQNNNTIKKGTVSDAQPLIVRPGGVMEERKCHCFSTGAMIRRPVFNQMGGYNLWFRCAEDLEYALRLRERYSYALLPDVLLKYRKHTMGHLMEDRTQIWHYYSAAYLCAYYRHLGKPEPIGEGVDVRDLLPLYNHFPEMLALKLIHYANRVLKKLLHAGEYHKLNVFFDDVDTAFGKHYKKEVNAIRNRFPLWAIKYRRIDYFWNHKNSSSIS